MLFLSNDKFFVLDWFGLIMELFGQFVDGINMIVDILLMRVYGFFESVDLFIEVSDVLIVWVDDAL